jgi:protein gp37
MFRDKERYGQDPTRVHRSSVATFDAPLRWQREAERGDRVGHDRLVFTCSWSDWFVEEADGAWRDDAWAIVGACPLLTFQVLTKRIERALGNFPADWGAGYANVWGGVSVEDQAMAEERIPPLLATPWRLRYLSVEPILGAIDRIIGDDLGPVFVGGETVPGIDWVIVGGESGNDTGGYRARPCNLDWIRSIVVQCKGADIPVWVKQLGSKPFLGGYLSLKDRHGEDWSEFPADLRVRQIPEVIHAP